MEDPVENKRKIHEHIHACREVADKRFETIYLPVKIILSSAHSVVFKCNLTLSQPGIGQPSFLWWRKVGASGCLVVQFWPNSLNWVSFLLLVFIKHVFFGFDVIDSVWVNPIVPFGFWCLVETQAGFFRIFHVIIVSVFRCLPFFSLTLWQVHINVEFDEMVLM